MKRNLLIPALVSLIGCSGSTDNNEQPDRTSNENNEAQKPESEPTSEDEDTSNDCPEAPDLHGGRRCPSHTHCVQLPASDDFIGDCAPTCEEDSDCGDSALCVSERSSLSVCIDHLAEFSVDPMEGDTLVLSGCLWAAPATPQEDLTLLRYGTADSPLAEIRLLTTGELAVVQEGEISLAEGTFSLQDFFCVRSNLLVSESAGHLSIEVNNETVLEVSGINSSPQQNPGEVAYTLVQELTDGSREKMLWDSSLGAFLLPPNNK